MIKINKNEIYLSNKKYYNDNNNFVLKDITLYN